MAKYLENHSISNNNEYILFLGFNIFSDQKITIEERNHFLLN